MTLSDYNIVSEGLGDLLKNLRKSSVKVGKKLANNVIKNPGRALDIIANVAIIVPSRNPKAVLSSLPEVIKLYHTGKGINLGNFV